MPKLHIWSQQKPVGPRQSKRHPHAARIHNSNRSHHSIKLHMGVTADDQRNSNSIKYRKETLFRRQPGENFRIAARSSVAEQNLAQPPNGKAKCCGPTRDYPLVFGTKLLRRPANSLSSLLWKLAALDSCQLGKHCSLPI